MGSCGLLPPGFRFHPTDEELIVHYLRNQATSRPCPVSIIPELNIYKFDPWELPAVDKAALGQEEWYFFTPRDRKYPNGARPNRATASGYWKATGTDKAIYSKSQYVGVKKALVFYKGRPPKGTKTDWIMHEYRLGGPSSTGSARPFMKANGSSSSSSSSMRLDDWVLCRIYQKKHPKRAEEGEGYSPSAHIPTTAAAAELDRVEHPPPRFPRSCSLAHLLEAAEYMPLSQMLNEYAADADDNFHTMTISFDGGSGALGGDMYAPGTAKPTGSSNLLKNQQGFVVGPIFHY